MSDAMICQVKEELRQWARYYAIDLVSVDAWFGENWLRVKVVSKDSEVGWSLPADGSLCSRRRSNGERNVMLSLLGLGPWRQSEAVPMTKAETMQRRLQAITMYWNGVFWRQAYE